MRVFQRSCGRCGYKPIYKPNKICYWCTEKVWGEVIINATNTPSCWEKVGT